MNKIACINVSIGIIFISICAYLCCIIPSYLFITTRCSFSCDNILIESMQQDIKEGIQKKILNTPFHALNLQEIKQAFSFLKDIHIWYHYPGKVHCSIQTHTPLVLINNSFMMVENGNLYALNFFDEELKHTIPSLEIMPKDFTFLSEYCVSHIKKIPASFFEQFKIVLVDHTCFELYDKKNPNIVLTINAQTVCNEKLLQRYGVIKRQLVAQRFFAKKNWRIDMRFKNQILVAQSDMGSS